MIDIALVESVIVNGLQSYLTNDKRPCTVLMANQTAPIPPYPYVSYTIITPSASGGGTYSIHGDGTRFKTVKQVWSFTVQSDDDIESKQLALKAADWFSLVGRVDVEDNNIVVEKIGDVGNRDNLLSIEYEYRNGFDVTLALTSTITKEDAERAGYIETVNLQRR